MTLAAPENRRSMPSPRHSGWTQTALFLVVIAPFCQWAVIILEDAFSGAIGIIKLAGADRPEKGAKADQAEADGDRNQDQEIAHVGLTPFLVNRGHRGLSGDR